MPVVMLLIIATLLIIAGASALLIGTDSVVPDRPLAAAMAGSISLVGGLIIVAIAFVLRELTLLRSYFSLRADGLVLPAGTARDQKAANLALPADAEQLGAASVSQAVEAPTGGLNPALAGAGALAAVAAAVAVNRPEIPDQSGAPLAKADREIDLFEQALTRMTGSSPEVLSAPASQTAQIEKPIADDMEAVASEPEIAANADVEDKKPDPVEALEPDWSVAKSTKDEFDLEAEFDHLLGNQVSMPPSPPVEMQIETPPVSDRSEPLVAEQNSVEDLPDSELIDEAATLSDEDKAQLESLVRSAIEDVEQREALETESANVDELIPAVPDLQTLREKIAPVAPAFEMESEDLVPEQIAIPAETDADVQDQDESALDQEEAAPAAEAVADSVTVPATASESAPITARTIVRTFSSGNNQYTMYSDGSISADTPSGRFEFASFNELREFIDTYKG